MKRMNIDQLRDAILAIRNVESYGSGTSSFLLPVGTKFNRTYYTPLAETKPDAILQSECKAKLFQFDEHGLRGWGVVKYNIIGDKQKSLYTRSTYVRLSWANIDKQPEVKKVLKEWLDKLTPDYAVSKDKGIIKFVNNKTNEVLSCDLSGQKFIRSYKKGKDRQIKYPTQFFKYVSGRMLIQGMKGGETYQNFSKLVDLVAKNYRNCRNFGTFLVRMFDHQHLESYIAAGVDFSFDTPFSYGDFSKDIRNKLNEYKIKYDANVGSLFCSDKDTGRAVFAQIKDCKGFANMVRILADNIQALNTLVNHYNYDLKTLFAYCRKKGWSSGDNRYRYYFAYERRQLVNPEETTEQIRAYDYDCINYLRDYARMALDVYGENYEKYPEDLANAHDTASALHQARAYNINAEKFEATIKKELEWKNKDFVVVYPKTADEIIAEGKKLRHCVGSYVHSVVRGECSIVFLRKKDDADTPLVTIEISGGNIRQARGFGNSSPTYDARMALQDYAKEKKLLYRG